MVGQEQISLASTENVARCAIHPRFLQDDTFSPQHLIDIKRFGKTFDYKTSVGWRKLLPSEGEVHAYGCRSAAISNSNKAKKNGEPVVPLVSAAHYVGFYEISVKDSEDQSNEAYKVFVEHFPEEGEDAHCHIVLEERPDLPDEVKRLKSYHRTNIVTGLWEHMEGPYKHVCDCDDEVREELEGIRLPHGGTDE